MKFVLLTPWKSPHQLPLAEAIASIIGEQNFTYLYLQPPPPNHVLWGWDKLGKQPWCVLGSMSDSILMDADVLLTGVRDIDLMERRERLGKRTFYMSERWFKPPVGMLRLLHPRYFGMARRMARLILKGCGFTYLPIGVHAAADMARVLRLFGRKHIALEKRPYAPMDVVGGLSSMRMWGYFVAPSEKMDCSNSTVDLDLLSRPSSTTTTESLRILWVGRMLKLKHVETIVKAVNNLNRREASRCYRLTLVGNGPERKRLEKMANREFVTFHDPVAVWEVRELMRAHDLYVFSSNGYDGWGAVVSEALEEGMQVIGTFESGASATILPPSHLFHCGDWRGLADIINRLDQSVDEKFISAGCWTAAGAARCLLNIE